MTFWTPTSVEAAPQPTMTWRYGEPWTVKSAGSEGFENLVVA
jgi:hypothetical protein